MTDESKRAEAAEALREALRPEVSMSLPGAQGRITRLKDAGWELVRAGGRAEILADLAIVLDDRPTGAHAEGCRYCGSKSVCHYCRPQVEARNRLKALLPDTASTPEPQGRCEYCGSLPGLPHGLLCPYTGEVPDCEERCYDCGGPLNEPANGRCRNPYHQTAGERCETCDDRGTVDENGESSVGAFYTYPCPDCQPAPDQTEVEERAKSIESARSKLVAEIGTYELHSPTGKKLLAMFEAMREAEEWCAALDRGEAAEGPEESPNGG